MQIRKIIGIVLRVALWVFLANVAITATIDRFTNIKLTETELLLRMPKTFFWDFKL